MKNPFFLLLAASIGMLFGSFPASAKTIDISKEYQGTIGQYIQVYQNEDVNLSLDDALEAYRNGYFSSTRHPIINFGINSKPVWLALQVRNPRPGAVHRNLLFETSWLDKIDIYFLQENQLINSYHVGDHMRFPERPLNHRFFVTRHHFEYGETTVLIRVESIDAMVLPIYFMSNEEIADRKILQSYSYGFVYGVILALIAYNFMLYVGLQNSPSYLFYSIYLLFFLILNISYTGHGYQWLWPDSPRWQQWSNPVLIVICSISGLIFALHFLNVKIALPRVYRIVIGSCMGFSILLLLIATLTGSYAITLLMSLIFIFFFSILMVILGVMSLQAGNRFAKYFLLASISTICGGAVTANAIWGLIPFNLFTYRAVEIGMMADAILLALALAERFNISQNEKLVAEKMAGIDSLTNLNNRWSFYKFVKPIWAMGLRNNSHTSTIMLDIDNFKLFNDNYGHALGDQVLVRLAETLQKEARSGDILARWGGEEFLIFLPDTKLSDATLIAERLRKKVSTIQLATVKGEKLSFTASFGVAHTNNIHVSLDELISLADQQLYRAKKQGRNCVCAN
ncbi:diguanylate cyclase [Nitrosomonas sp. Nm166]|uniref:sensor domain-containing diguanylate cyclase n=1 Tax=Nitrosomonas sp. Nm166 TaxID=1881054 RepID=UPI0008E89C75|nr:diguanylate cyclase [Nitrosomonas sp. Nm166]SFE37555.1 diguanylate cyclase (GGDEF) domain-containing protein [Nitrosomonas sp. Nm166]